ncbi:MAG: OmpA family protein [Cytophagales bacterium]|nr:OmpA family protein [Cytophagales bacterium]MDW8385290.1 OmpA family protein [Flammeovirgaceae bacterium]
MRVKLYYSAGLLVVLHACGPSLKKAQENYKLGYYQKAIPIYEKLLNKPDMASQRGKISFMIAESYRLSGDMQKALLYYEKADKAKYLSNHLGFYYGHALKSIGNYAQAKELYERYIKIATDKGFINYFRDEIEFLNNFDKKAQDPTYISVKIADSVNTTQHELSAVPYHDGIVFTSNRRKEKISLSTGKGFYDLYFAKIGDSEKPVLFGESFNLDGVNDEHATFTADGNTIVFVRSSLNKEKSPFKESHLYISTFQNGHWSVPQLLKATSGTNCLNITPFLTPDGSMLYFASNRAGGYGGFDLYRAKRDEKGQYGSAENLGKEINTIGDEISPFVVKNQLFFASDGHVGWGGFDIFLAEKSTDGKISIKNLGLPLNTRYDEFSLYFKDEKNGYFTSNRLVEESKGGFDIYEFTIGEPPKVINYFLAGHIRADLDSTSAALDGAEIQLIEENQVVDVTTSDVKGNFRFSIKVYPDRTYTVRATRKGYLPASVEFNGSDKRLDEKQLVQPITNHTWQVSLSLKPNLFVNPDTAGLFSLEALYFAPEDTTLNENAQKALVSVIDYLRAFPDQKVSFQCYSDEIKDKNKNLELTQKRAQTIVSYLLSAGISAERIFAEGKGDAQLKIKKPKTEAEKRINRRIVFKFEPKQNS